MLSKQDKKMFLEAKELRNELPNSAAFISPSLGLKYSMLRLYNASNNDDTYAATVAYCGLSTLMDVIKSMLVWVRIHE